jgi:hypothetical protein
MTPLGIKPATFQTVAQCSQNAGSKVKILSTSYLSLERKTAHKNSNKLKYSHILYLSDIPSGNNACATHIPEILDSMLFAGTRKE